MKTDIPLKRLTQLCPTDLLPLFGATGATVLRVESLELPTGKSSLDCVLHLLAPDGTSYIHLVEWQGWNDPVFLWRSLSYLGWMGQHRQERPIMITVIYLKPGDDVGDTLLQQMPEQHGWSVHLPCVRLWEQDAQQAVVSGQPGLLALSPLMGGATPALVETAAQEILHTSQPPMQADLLTALGVFAESMVPAERFVRLITKERLMSSDLFTLVYQDKLAEMAQELAARDAEQERWQAAMQQAVERVFLKRFPKAPALLLSKIRHIHNPSKLEELHDILLEVPDLATLEQAMNRVLVADTSSP